MDPMVIGQTIYFNGGAGSQSYSTPWLPREGDVGTFTVEVTVIQASGTELKFDVETKNTEDADSSATSAVSQTFTSTGTKNMRAATLKELVRYTLTTNSETNDGWVHFRTLDPQWEFNY